MKKIIFISIVLFIASYCFAGYNSNYVIAYGYQGANPNYKYVNVDVKSSSYQTFLVQYDMASNDQGSPIANISALVKPNSPSIPDGYWEDQYSGGPDRYGSVYLQFPVNTDIDHTRTFAYATVGIGTLYYCHASVSISW